MLGVTGNESCIMEQRTKRECWRNGGRMMHHETEDKACMLGATGDESCAKDKACLVHQEKDKVCLA
jgi:hypothetical protein